MSQQQAVEAWAVLGNAIYLRERAAWQEEWIQAEAEEHREDDEQESEPKVPARRYLAWSKGELPVAEAAFRKVLELTGGTANKTRLSLVEVVRRLGRNEEALTILEEYQQIEKAAGREPRTEALESCLKWMGRDFVDTPGGEVIKPRRVNRVVPVYPVEARSRMIEGKVMLETIVTEDGNVECIDVMRDQPMGLSAAAVQAVRQWRFKPAMVAGQPVAVWYSVTVNFQLL